MSSAFDEAQRRGLLATIERDDRALRAALAELKATVQQEWAITRHRVDVRERISERPALFLGAAFVVGVWLGARGHIRFFNEQPRRFFT